MLYALNQIKLVKVKFAFFADMQYAIFFSIWDFHPAFDNAEEIRKDVVIAHGNSPIYSKGQFYLHALIV